MTAGRLSALVSLLLAAAIVSLWASAEGADGLTQGDTAKGKALFAKHCAGCHGKEGKGDGYKLLGRDPADLTAPSTAKKPDTGLLQAIHKGRPNMPAWEALLSDQESRDVLAYVRSLTAR
jgi:mono/diheme cytochrome c family protein